MNTCLPQASNGEPRQRQVETDKTPGEAGWRSRPRLKRPAPPPGGCTRPPTPPISRQIRRINGPKRCTKRSIRSMRCGPRLQNRRTARLVQPKPPWTTILPSRKPAGRLCRRPSASEPPPGSRLRLPGSAPRPGGWKRSASCSRICPGRPGWRLSSCSILIPPTRATSVNCSRAPPKIRCSTSRLGCGPSRTSFTCCQPTRV